jgi:hypothetical protein
MKKLFFILALVAVYAVSASSVKINPVADEKSQITVVADLEDDVKSTTLEDEKKKKDKKKTKAAATSCCPQKETVKTGCSTAQQKSCAASKVSCTEVKKKVEKK